MRGVPALALGTALVLTLGTLAIAQDPRVDEFVGRAFAHGVPFEEAVRLRSPAAQQQLSAILESEAQAPRWANAATMLGMIGDAGAVPTLTTFVSRGDGRLDASRYNAKTAAIFALGYILNRTPDSPAALDFLRTGLNPENWSSRIRWTSPFTENPRRRNVQLSLASVRALGVSGLPEAAQMLRGAPAQSASADQPARAAIQATVDDALRANAAVRTLGLGTFLSRQQSR